MKLPDRPVPSTDVTCPDAPEVQNQSVTYSSPEETPAPVSASLPHLNGGKARSAFLTPVAGKGEQIDFVWRYQWWEMRSLRI